MTRIMLALMTACFACFGAVHQVSAQAATGTPASPRPTGRVSFFTSTSQTHEDDGTGSGFSDFTTMASYQATDRETDGLEFGVDVRQSAYAQINRPARVSIYEGYVGSRFGGGVFRARAGHLWLNDLGALGAVAGGLLEVRQSPRRTSGIGHLRAGLFGGLEPNTYDKGYAPNVRKYGGYVSLDGKGIRRHVLGFVTVRDASLTERAVLTATNYVPVGKRFFLYQASEYDVTAPAGQARPGLSYFFANARFSPVPRVELQGNYNRGRSIDTRSLSEDVLNGRPLTQMAIDGLLYESTGGRVTVEVVRRVRAYVGYSRDKNNRDDAATGRLMVGGYAGNVMNSGFDVSATDSLMDRPTGSYHSRYLSVGHPVGHAIYVSGDYTTSLSVLRYSRSDGILIDLRPRMRRLSGSGVINLSRMLSLLTTVDMTRDDQSSTFHLLAGITCRF